MVTVCPSQFATRRTLFHVLVGCGLLMLKVRDRKSGSAGMPRPISYAVFCLKKKTKTRRGSNLQVDSKDAAELSGRPSVEGDEASARAHLPERAAHGGHS